MTSSHVDTLISEDGKKIHLTDDIIQDDNFIGNMLRSTVGNEKSLDMNIPSSVLENYLAFLKLKISEKNSSDNMIDVFNKFTFFGDEEYDKYVFRKLSSFNKEEMKKMITDVSNPNFLNILLEVGSFDEIIQSNNHDLILRLIKNVFNLTSKELIFPFIYSIEEDRTEEERKEYLINTFYPKANRLCKLFQLIFKNKAFSFLKTLFNDEDEYLEYKGNKLEAVFSNEEHEEAEVCYHMSMVGNIISNRIEYIRYDDTDDGVTYTLSFDNEGILTKYEIGSIGPSDDTFLILFQKPSEEIIVNIVNKEVFNYNLL